MAARTASSASPRESSGDRVLRHALRGIIHAGPCAFGVLCDQPSADSKSRYAHDLAFVDQRKLGRAAADIDMQPAGVTPPRQGGRTGAVRRQDAFELVAGGGADEFS